MKHILDQLVYQLNEMAKTQVVTMRDVKVMIGCPSTPADDLLIFIPNQGWDYRMPVDPNSPEEINAKRYRDSIIEKAKEIISGERQGQYGKPENSFHVIAQMWSAYLDYEVSASDVAAMMVLLKTARISNGVYKDDNWIDIIGYAALGAEIQAMEDDIDGV